MIEAIIFDMDGTLIDSEKLHVSVWEHIAARYDRVYTPELKRSLLGRGGINGVLKYVINHWQLNVSIETLRAEMVELYEQLSTDSLTPMNGAPQTLEHLTRAKFRKAIATGSSRNWAHNLLKRFELDRHFEVVITSDDVQNNKPHPESYITALERLGLAPHQAIAIEDSPNGIRSAKDAGLFVVALKNDHALPEDLGMADLVIDSLLEITHKWLDSLQLKC